MSIWNRALSHSTARPFGLAPALSHIAACHGRGLSCQAGIGSQARVAQAAREENRSASDAAGALSFARLQSRRRARLAGSLSEGQNFARSRQNCCPSPPLAAHTESFLSGQAFPAAGCLLLDAFALARLTWLTWPAWLCFPLLRWSDALVRLPGDAFALARLTWLTWPAWLFCPLLRWSDALVRLPGCRLRFFGGATLLIVVQQVAAIA